MPELPEVETIRRGLTNSILRKKIVGITVINSSPIRGNKNNFISSLKNNVIEDVARIGKLLILKFSDEKFLLVHLKMTGQLIYKYDHKIIAGGHNLPRITEKDLPSKYTWVIWEFEDKSKLYFNDMRRFGYLEIVDQTTKDKIASKYGIEPLAKNFTLESFKKVIDERKAPIKAVLLNQQLIAGIGNIYADEICFEAKIRPDKPAHKLNEEEINNLYESAGKIIKEAILHGGTTFKDYVNAHGANGTHVDYLKVYKRGGEKCLRCSRGIISVSRVVGRGTHFCPICQK